MPPDPRFFQGLEHFNAENFFEAHEAWEDYWLEHRGPERLFYQGLIQAAVSCYHHAHGNPRGRDPLFEAATKKLEPYRPSCEGLDVDRFLADFAEWHRRVTSSGTGDDAATGKTPFPEMRLIEPAADTP